MDIILDDILKWFNIDTSKSDYFDKAIKFYKPLNVIYSERVDWQNCKVELQEEVSVYADGSKTSKGTGSGVLIESIKLDNQCIVGQILPIRQVCIILLDKGTANMYIHSDIHRKSSRYQGSNIKENSRLVRSLKIQLSRIIDKYQVRFC